MNQSIDLLWVLIAGTMVFLMQPGFMALESGLTRSKNSINVAIKNLADFMLSILSFWLIGYGLMFGASKIGIVGTTGFLFQFETVSADVAAFFFFQAMFCGTATTIFSGAVAERMSFSGYLLSALLLSTLVYPIFGHWTWAGIVDASNAGWLARRGFVDFAGSTVVHSIGGWFALAAVLVIGPRTGRFDDNGAVNEIPGSNIPLSVLGTLLLWFGWFGFNGGSTLALNETVPLIIANTALAGAAGAASNLSIGWVAQGIPKPGYLINGSLGGLVAVTAGCFAVGTVQALVIGLIAGVVSYATEALLLRMRVDDAVGAIPVHLGAGIWGTIAVAIFGNPAVLATGLGRSAQLWAQIQGVIAGGVIGFALPLLLLLIVNRYSPFRITAEEEDIGLNVAEHGAKTELFDLLTTMDLQARTQDPTLRVPEEPFTEVGHIARRYNEVMDAMADAMGKTQAIFRSATDAILTYSVPGLRILTANPRASEVFGRPVDDLEGREIDELFPRNVLTRIHETRTTMLPQVVNGLRRDGGFVPLETTITAPEGRDSDYLIGTFRDVTEKYQYEERIEYERALFQKLFRFSPQAIVLVDSGRRVLDINPSFERLFEFTKAELLGTLLEEAIVPEGSRREQEEILAELSRGGSVYRDTYRRKKNGSLIPVSLLGYTFSEEAATSDLCFIYQDRSDREAYEAQLKHQALHDALTNLPNRLLFSESVEGAIRRRRRFGDENYAVLLIDMDDFKGINDTLGHIAGDAFLQEVSTRLSEGVRETDVVARLGGDEFGILLHDRTDHPEVAIVVDRLLELLSEPFLFEDRRIPSGASIGVALGWEGYNTAEEIIRDADVAMYQAKSEGKGRYATFDSQMFDRVQSTAFLKQELTTAINQDQFRLVYQPLVDLETGRVIGFESLLRWDHPERGVVPPARFIPLAEESGLIGKIDDWVMRTALSQLKRWQSELPEAEDLIISVNISGARFYEDALFESIERNLVRSGVKPKNLKIEITEGVLLRNYKDAIQVLMKLKEQGISFAIDDFGTGYSSLSYLQMLPVDEIKIDRAFVSGTAAGKEGRAIVKTILSLAEALGLRVIAEGIEDDVQRTWLTEMRCPIGQGYFFSKPLDPREAKKLIVKGTSPRSGQDASLEGS